MVIADASLAPHHAELVITDDGRLYLTDCATDARHLGQRRRGRMRAGSLVRQDFVRPDQPLRLGDHRCTASDLLRRTPRRAGGRLSAGGGAWHGGRNVGVRGPVARDPATGEIVRRRP